MKIPFATVVLVSLACALSPSPAAAQRLDIISLERAAKFTETQRYQMDIAEDYYRKKRDYKIAAAEYEKYLALYETSDAASYAQLMWSICMVQQRKSNTAIKEGFQSVIDYWPDSPDAVKAAYYIGSTYRAIGRIPEAKKAFRKVLAQYEDHLVAVLAARDLAALAVDEKDTKTAVEMWRRLTFDFPRNKANQDICTAASRSLAQHLFRQAAFSDGVEALTASFPEGQPLDDAIVADVNSQLPSLVANDETKAVGDRLATQAMSYLHEKMPTAADAKDGAKHYWLQIAAVQGAARMDDQVPKTYEHILKTFGSDDGVLGRLAGWYQARGQWDQSRATYLRYENKIEGLNQVAASHKAQGNLEPAVRTYEKLIGLDPDNRFKWKGQIAWTYWGNQYAKAATVFEELAAEDIQQSEHWRYYLAECLRHLGKYKEAIGHFRQCPSQHPNNIYRMATCQRALKNYGEAIVLYGQLTGEQKQAPTAMLNIAYTREEAGQKDQAIKAFQLVCKRFPKQGQASTAHAHLQKKYNISITLGGAKDE